MAGWRDRLRRGSYNKIPFYLDTSETEGGRRTFMTQFPLKDVPHGEDLGKAETHFQLEVFVLGPAWMDDRDALETALATAGPGELVHPKRGSFKVMPGKFRTRETNTEQGYARVSCEFFVVDDTPVNPPLAVVGATVNAAAAALDASAGFSFTQGFSVAGPIALVGLAEQALTRTLDEVATLTSSLDAVANTPADQIRHIEQQLTTLVLTPATLGLQLVTAIHTITDSEFDPVGAFRVQLSILAAAARPAGGASTDVERQANANAGNFNTLVRLASYAECARLISGEVDRDGSSSAGVTFETRDQALAAKAALQAQADLLLLDVDGASLLPLMELNAAVGQAFDALMPTASLMTITLPANLPALVLAQQLYGDANRADEIVSRNGIAHPMFLPAGVELEVLSD